MGDVSSLLKTERNNIGIANESGTAVIQWLRCCATNRKVAGSIPAGGIFIDIKSFRILGSTQPLTEMSTRNFLGYSE